MFEAKSDLQTGVGFVVVMAVGLGILSTNAIGDAPQAAIKTTESAEVSRVNEVNRQALGALKLTQEQEGRLLGMILESRRIDAIKYLKSLKPQLSIKDAKDRVEEILPIRYPGR